MNYYQYGQRDSIRPSYRLTGALDNIWRRCSCCIRLFDESVRGGAFGGGAVVMSIIAFVIARKEYAPAVSALLFVNGGLIIAGMIALIAQGALASEDSSGAMRTIGSTIAMGAILIGLGVWKVATDRKVVAATGKEPAQK
jgi:hypothetical protein